MTLTKRTVKGVMWSGSSMISTNVINFIVLAILLRLLSPSDFGLMGMVMVVINFAILIADLGLGSAVIQNQDVTEEQLSTFFYLNIILGIILCGVLYFSSGLIADFFNKRELINLLKVISLSFIIISIGQTFRTLLRKLMDFKVLFKVELSGIIIYGIFSIFFAIMGLGVWSLIYSFLIRQIGETILLLVFTAFKPKLIFKLKKIKRLINFGIYVFGERILNYFNRNLDYIIIGKILGAEALGFYTLAYQLMLFPVWKISGTISKVLFPALSIVQNNNKKIQRGYLKVIKYISLVTFPMMAGLFIVAPEFITVIYGEKWLPAISVLQILCIVGAIQSIATTVGTIQYSKGRSDISFKLNCFTACFTAIAFLIGVRWGINGVAAAYAIMSIILFPIIQTITNRLIDLRWGQFLKQFINHIIGATLVILFISIFKMFFIEFFGLSKSFVLIISILLGISVYSVFIFLKDKPFIIESLKMLNIRVKS